VPARAYINPQDVMVPDGCEVEVLLAGLSGDRPNRLVKRQRLELMARFRCV
jgi:hypothetical protein